MGNILFVSDFNANQINDNPGGDTPTGTVEWLTPLLHTTFEGDISNTNLREGAAWEQLILRDENKFVWPRRFNYYSAGGSKDHLLYSVTSENLTTLAKNYVSNALNGFTMSLVYQQGCLWLSGASRRLLLVSDNYYPGTNPILFASVDLDSGQLHTGLTASQVTSATGNPYVTAQYPQIAVSPNGQHVIANLQASSGSTQRYKLYRLELGANDYFANVSQLSSFTSTVERMRLLATSDSAIYTEEPIIGGSGDRLRRRDITTGAITDTIAPPVGTVWYQLNLAWQTSNHLWVTGKYGTTATTAVNAGLKLCKISKATHQVVAQWDLSEPPLTTPGYTPSTNNPLLKANQNLESAQFDRDGILYISYGDSQYQQVTGGGQVTRRFYRVKLS